MIQFPSHSKLAGIAFLSLAVASATAQSQLPTNGQVVAKPGDAPIGVAPGETIAATTSAVDTGVISRDGNILFRGTLVGMSVTTLNNRALFIGHTNEDLTLVARTNTTVLVPALPNSVPLQVSAGTGLPNSSNVFGSYRISPTGNFVLFTTQLYDGGNPGLDGLVHTAAAGTVNDAFMFWGPPGALQVIAQQNVTTMLPGGAVLTSFSGNLFSQQASSLNSAGTAIFKVQLAGGDVVGTTNDIAWIRGLPGGLSYFIREGDLVNGGLNAIAETWSTTNNAFNCVINENGDVLHDNKLSLTLGSSPAAAANDSVVFITPASTGVHTVFVREGDVAVDTAGMPIGGVFYGTPTVAQGFGSNATAAFHSTLTGAVTTLDDGALFVGNLGATLMVAREGDLAPDTGGETIAVINSSASYSETAGLLFGCSLVSPGIGVTTMNDSALYFGKLGFSPTLIAREGAPCPGLAGYSFGSLSGGSNFGSSSGHKANARGQAFFGLDCNDGVNTVNVLWSYDPLHGLQPQLISNTTLGDVVGGGIVTSISPPLQFPGGDGSTAGFTENGDFIVRCNTTANVGSFIARGHVGSLNGTPSAVDVNGGQAHNMTLDVTPTYGNQFYFILATGLGTDVGFPHPLNFGVTVPIDFDPTWTTVSQAFVNTALWTNTLFVTDATGKPLGNPPINFNMPPGFPGFLGTTLKHSALLFDGALVGTYATEPTTCYLY